MKLFGLIFLLAVSAAAEKNVRSARQYRIVPPSVPGNQWPSYNLIDPYGPGTYAYGFQIDDPQTNNVQFRDEEKLPDGTVRGRYGLVLPNGEASVTQYIADEQGYRSSIDRIKAAPYYQPPQEIPVYYPAQLQQGGGGGGGHGIGSSTPSPALSANLQNSPVLADPQQAIPQQPGIFGGFFQRPPTGPFGQFFTTLFGNQNQGNRPFQNWFSNIQWPWQNSNSQAAPVAYEDYVDFQEVPNNGLSPFSPLYVTNPNSKESGWFKRFIERRRWNQLLKNANVVAITPAPAVYVNKK